MAKVLEHKHLIIRAKVKKPPNDTQAINEWIRNLVDKIGMKILMGPYSVYSEMTGNKGLTVATIIETSHIVMHVWDEVDPGLLQFDVYTCSKLDPKDVFEELEQFEPVELEYQFIDREHSIKVLELKTLELIAA